MQSVRNHRLGAVSVPGPRARAGLGARRGGAGPGRLLPPTGTPGAQVAASPFALQPEAAWPSPRDWVALGAAPAPGFMEPGPGPAAGEGRPGSPFRRRFLGRLWSSFRPARSRRPARAPGSAPATPGDGGDSRARALRSASPGDGGDSRARILRSASPGDGGDSRARALRSASPADGGDSRARALRSASPADGGDSRARALRSASPADGGDSRARILRSASPGDGGDSRARALRSASPGDGGDSRARILRPASPGDGGDSRARAPRSAFPGDGGDSRARALRSASPGDGGDGAARVPGAAERPPGAQGLKNHGNTCFMNAVVQCLSNTDLLAEFLALGRYRAAPGRAEVTGQLAALVRALWTRQYRPQLSAAFKNAVSKYGSQFQGNYQHDALEFLLWLLDRVHKDLENSPQGPRTQKLHRKASKTSENCVSPSTQLSLGQSFVQSHFQAQYRSSLTCPHCLKQSNTFDPFLCVSLPIPLRQTRFLSITLVFPSKSQKFLRVGLAVPILSTVAALRRMVAEEGGVPAHEVILVELCSTGLQRSFFDEDDLNTISEGDSVYAFQTSLPPVQEITSVQPSSLPLSPCMVTCEGQQLSMPTYSKNKVLILFCNLVGSGQLATRFGPPFLIREDRAISWAQLQQRILSKVHPLMKSKASVQNLGSLFSIRVVGLSVPCSYLSPQDKRPLYHWAVDRVLHLRKPGGPPHIKLAVEWDSWAKECLFGNLQQEKVQDADSVWRQQRAHQQHSCTLDECFHLYTKEEQLAQDDAWKCPHCKVLQQGVMKLSLWTLPDILIIHLKRFCQVRERRNKLSTLVKFPLSGLNMAPHMAKRSASAKSVLGPLPSWKQPVCLPTSCPLDFLYDLYAVCNHHGSLQSGHYTAYCRNSLDGQWYNYDDTIVEKLREDEVNTQGAYILFYQKRNSIPPWSASSSMKGSTCSSFSEHWLLRLGGNDNGTKESLLPWSSPPGSPQPPGPESPLLTNHLSSHKMEGLESRLREKRTGGRSMSMKALTSSQGKQKTFKTLPSRWSFGPKEKLPGASVELVEYLETRGRPQCTSQSIVSLLAGTAGENEKSTVPRSNTSAFAKDEDGELINQCLLATAPHLLGHPSHCARDTGHLHTARKHKENSRPDIRLPKQFDLPLMVMPSVEHEKHSCLEDQKTRSCQGSHSTASSAKGDLPSVELPRKGACNHRNPFTKMRTKTEGKVWETDRFPQGTFTFLKSVFWKKENKKNDQVEVAPQVPPASLISGRLTLADSSSASLSPARGHGTHLERDIHSAPASLRLARKVSRPIRGNALGASQRSVSGEQTSSSTLQKVKYRTLFLGQKKILPESSF
ncbi:ubiquitin carboxyl-terminal hydrolase 43 [Sorex fumeus]|uniref:ubiquitin carboxyl-terminal hydrolase 43 n=1 Tax=Sorex fumeus TaxID=62283 RepID=UPI0024AD748F|nr:ubiquitin carboxyl-terminal hydrolase 43 [Sorex fumeus]